MQVNLARPQLWVKLFVNPFVHKKGKGSLIRRNSRIDVLPFNPLISGINCTVVNYTVVNNGMGSITIGDGVSIGLSNVLIGPVENGSNIILTQHLVVSGINHGYEDINTPIRLQPCTTSYICIEDDSWIGANAVITIGVTIGKPSIVSA
jgi:acetyltransferase-like isoleucine patch superfamily enzyme